MKHVVSLWLQSGDDHLLTKQQPSFHLSLFCVLTLARKRRSKTKKNDQWRGKVGSDVTEWLVFSENEERNDEVLNQHSTLKFNRKD